MPPELQVVQVSVRAAPSATVPPPPNGPLVFIVTLELTRPTFGMGGSMAVVMAQ